MKKYLLCALFLSLSVIIVGQFIVPRELKKSKKSVRKLQEECCQLSLDIQRTVVSCLHNIADLNELIISAVSGCVMAEKEPSFIVNDKTQLESVINQLKDFKENMISTRNKIASFVIQHRK